MEIGSVAIGDLLLDVDVQHGSLASPLEQSVNSQHENAIRDPVCGANDGKVRSYIALAISILRGFSHSHHRVRERERFDPSRFSTNVCERHERELRAESAAEGSGSP